MDGRRKVFLARNNKTNFHSLFEVIPSGREKHRQGVLGIDTMNALIQWKNVDELVAVLEETGPVIMSDIHKGAGRLISIGDAVTIAESGGRGHESQGYGLNDETFLRIQLYLDGQTGFYPPKASIRRAVEKYGLLESGAVEDLRAWAEEDPEAMVAVEPVEDLCFIRNLCSICLRIIANYQCSDVDDVLEKSGFRHVDRAHKWWVPKTYKDSYYVIPFHHNSADDMTINFSWKWGRNVFAYMIIDPLNQLIYSQAPKGVKHAFGSIESAETLASPALTGKGRPIINYGFDYEDADTRIYLALCDDVTQREAAEKYVYGVIEMFSGLRSKHGELLGWDFSTPPELAGNDYPKPVFHSLASAMVGTLAYREGALPVTCKNCGNGMFVRPKGKRREFCSDSCRSQHSAGKASMDG